MAVTRLKRKGLRNKARAKQRQDNIKKLTRMPPIENVDVDAIKEEFAQKSGKPVSKKVEETTPEKITSKPSDNKDASASELASAQEESRTGQSQADKSGSKTDQAPVVAEPVAETDTTAELREPAKGSVEDAEMMEEVVEEAEEKEETQPEVAPDVVSPEAGAPDETPSEADDTDSEEKK